MNAAIVTCTLLLGAWVPPPEDPSLITLRVKYIGRMHAVPMDPALLLARDYIRHQAAQAKKDAEDASPEPAQVRGRGGPAVANVSGSWMSPLKARLAGTKAGLIDEKTPLPSAPTAADEKRGATSGQPRHTAASLGTSLSNDGSAVRSNASSGYTAPSVPGGNGSYMSPYGMPAPLSADSVSSYLGRQQTTVSSYLQRATPYASQMHLGSELTPIGGNRPASAASPQFNPRTQNAPGYTQPQYFNNTGSYFGH
jgi:hypothetical protein